MLVMQIHTKYWALLILARSGLVAIKTVSVGYNWYTKYRVDSVNGRGFELGPFESAEDKILLDRLASQSRRFMKGLRYNMGTDKPLACAALPDQAPIRPGYM
jgi:hypothetical protein